jgi:hypothetical protein
LKMIISFYTLNKMQWLKLARCTLYVKEDVI